MTRDNSPTVEILDHDRPWTVRLVRPGDHYGAGHRLVHGNSKTSLGQEPLLEFYDSKHAGEPQFMEVDPENGIYGQFVSRYYINTLTKGRIRLENTGLDLQGDVPAWKMSAEGMQLVFQWLDTLGIDQERSNDFPIAAKLVNQLKRKYQKVFYDRPSGRGSVSIGPATVVFREAKSALFFSVTAERLKFENTESAVKFVGDLQSLFGKI